MAPSFESIGDAFDNAAEKMVTSLFKNDAVAKDSLFRTGPSITEPEVADVAVDWVHWCNNERLHSTLGYRAPVEFEERYYDEISGSLPNVVASKLTV